VGVYDPAQARIEAESVKAIAEKYQANTDPEFRTRAIVIKEQRAELVKHHLWVLWTDYFKPPHFEKYPNLNQLFNEATKLAGASGVKGSMDPAVGDQLLRQDRGDLQDLLGDQGRREPRVHHPAGTSRGTCRPFRRWCTSWADFERAAGECHLTDDQLAGRPLRRSALGLRRTSRSRRAASRSAWRCGSSTSPPGRGAHGLYLEDLYVRPAARGTGAGGALLAALAAVCVERGYRRMEWVMLDWNPAAEFLRRDRRDGHRGLGGRTGWPGPRLHRLAERASRTSTVSG